MAKKSKKSGTKRASKKSSKKKPKKKSAKRTSKRKSPAKNKRTPAKKQTKKKSTKKTEPDAPEKAKAPPADEPEPDVEPQPTEESLTPPASPSRTPEEPDHDQPERTGGARESERPWAPDEDEDTPPDPWDEPEERPAPGAGRTEPSPWDAPEPTPAEEEERTWAIPETPPEEPEPAPPEEPEPDPWPSPDDDVVTAEPAAPPEPERQEEAAETGPWEPVTEEPAPRPEPEPAPPAEEEGTARGWRVSGTREEAQTETDQPQRGWPTRAPDRDELRARFDEASVRMGLPPMAAFGWSVFMIGLLLVTYAYYDVYAANADSVLLVAGVIRYDVLGAILLILGLITALIFHFVPTRRPHGPQPEDSPAAWVARADKAARWVTTHRTLSIIGWGVAIFGLAIAAIALYVSWINSEGGLVDYGITIAGSQILYWRIGAVLAFVGLILVVLTYTRMRNARDARQGYLLAALAALDRNRVAQQAATEATTGATARTPAAEPPRRPAGVTEAELRALMRKLDGLMSSLPEQQVAEFANTPEAETYLSLLESSR